MEPIPGPSSTATTPPAVHNLEAFQQLFPGVVQDGVLDAARLGEALGIDVAGIKDGKERFGLMWAGKHKAVEALQAPSYAALVPDMENSVNWDTAENVFIEGDNLEVLKLLQNAYNDQVKLIYIDPPYNTGNDFVYNDDFSDPLKHYLEVTGQIDADGNRLVANVEASGRKHSKWLTMMYPRLVLARNLLTQDGVICISIDDNELHNLRQLCDEVFGATNYISTFNWKKRGTGGQVANNAIIDQVEYVLMYARDINSAKLSGLPNENVGKEKWRSFRKSGGQWQKRFRPNQHFPIWAAPDGLVSLDPQVGYEAIYPLDSKGVEGFWENGRDTAAKRLSAGELRARNINGRVVIEQLEVGSETSNAGNFIELPSTAGANETKAIFGSMIFENAKPIKFLENLLHIAGLQDGDIAMDFFAGSGTFAQAVDSYCALTGRQVSWLINTIGEPVKTGTLAHELGMSTVSEISLMRLRKLNLEFRSFELKRSSFNRNAEFDQDLLLRNATLLGNWEFESVLWEILLASGVALSSIERNNAGHPNLRFFENIAVALEPLGSFDLGEISTLGTSVLLCLEDHFAGRDDLKANLYYACKKANITFKTF